LKKKKQLAELPLRQRRNSSVFQNGTCRESLDASSFESFYYGDVGAFVSVDSDAFRCYGLSASLFLKLLDEFFVLSDFLVEFGSVFVVV